MDLPLACVNRALHNTAGRRGFIPEIPVSAEISAIPQMYLRSKASITLRDEAVNGFGGSVNVL